MSTLLQLWFIITLISATIGFVGYSFKFSALEKYNAAGALILGGGRGAIVWGFAPTRQLGFVIYCIVTVLQILVKFVVKLGDKYGESATTQMLKSIESTLAEQANNETVRNLTNKHSTEMAQRNSEFRRTKQSHNRIMDRMDNLIFQINKLKSPGSDRKAAWRAISTIIDDHFAEQENPVDHDTEQMDMVQFDNHMMVAEYPMQWQPETQFVPQYRGQQPPARYGQVVQPVTMNAYSNGNGNGNNLRSDGKRAKMMPPPPAPFVSTRH